MLLKGFFVEDVFLDDDENDFFSILILNYCFFFVSLEKLGFLNEILVGSGRYSLRKYVE